MSEKLLEIKNIYADVDDKNILKGLSLSINKGETHVVMGPNGAGKSTLVNVIMGNPKYEITKGKIIFEGKDIASLKPHERAKEGIFLSFQNPEEIPGITVENFLRTAKNSITGEQTKIMTFRKELKVAMQSLQMDESYASRYLNVGFSGGEKKKNEILQMLMLNPKLAILDESDSGLDVDAVKIVSEGVSRFKNKDNAVIIITHNAGILKYLKPDKVHVLIDGKIVTSGDASLVDKVNSQGFSNIDAF